MAYTELTTAASKMLSRDEQIRSNALLAAASTVLGGDASLPPASGLDVDALADEVIELARRYEVYLRGDH